MTSDSHPTSNSKLYAERDHYALSPHFERHMLALTGERLESKSAIAAELAHRDAEIERLTRQRTVQKAVNDLAYIPHRNLVESREGLQKRYDKVEAERDRLRAALELRNTALRLIKAGPPLRMANDAVASWAAFIASEALSGEHPPSETRVDVLTNEQCERIIEELQAQEWSGISRDDVRLWDGLITSMRLESSPKARGEPTS